ncbi:hypothetical protein Aduo_010840 [Ancylostoma duodenale]
MEYMLQNQNYTLNQSLRYGVWVLDGPPPFKKVEIDSMLIQFLSRDKDTPYQKFAALYRYILMRITDPPTKIKEYSIRINGKHGRDEGLHNLPQEILTFLLDMGEDLIGFGHNELKTGIVVNPEESGFFMSLGNTDDERVAVLNYLTDQRVSYRSDLFNALQLALRDVRAYGYDHQKQEWTPSSRKSKRATVPGPGQDKENEGPKRVAAQLDFDAPGPSGI